MQTTTKDSRQLIENNQDAVAYSNNTKYAKKHKKITCSFFK